MKIINICVFCGEEHSVNVPLLSWYKYINENETTQKALPMLSATEREQLASGLCPKCQKKIF